MNSLNADGLDDFVCIYGDGSVHAWINQWNGNGSNPPTFVEIGQISASPDGKLQDRTRVGDGMWETFDPLMFILVLSLLWNSITNTCEM